MTPEEETFSKLQEPAPVVTEYGTKIWYDKKGQVHRDNDLPAVIFDDGEQWWLKHGKRHREHAPAMVMPKDNDRWYIDNVKIKNVIWYKIKKFIVNFHLIKQP